MYLEYNNVTGEVVEIHETIPNPKSGYSIAFTEQFVLGDEFEQRITVLEVDEENNLSSYSAIRNNPHAKRLLEENINLKQQVMVMQKALDELILGGL